MPLLPFPKEQQPESKCTVYRPCTPVLFTKACHGFKFLLIHALFIYNSFFFLSSFPLPLFSYIFWLSICKILRNHSLHGCYLLYCFFQIFII